MERLQMGGVAQSNDSIAVVNISSRPGTASSQGKPAAAVAGAACSSAVPSPVSSAVLGSPDITTRSSSMHDTANVATSMPDSWTGAGLRWNPAWLLHLPHISSQSQGWLSYDTCAEPPLPVHIAMSLPVWVCLLHHGNLQPCGMLCLWPCYWGPTLKNPKTSCFFAPAGRAVQLKRT